MRRGAVVSAARRLERVDVLLAHDWPAGITPDDADVGNTATRQLVERLRPRLSLHGHHHRAFETSIDPTKVRCLNAVPSAAGQSRARHGWWRLWHVDDEHVLEVAVAPASSSAAVCSTFHQVATQ